MIFQILILTSFECFFLPTKLRKRHFVSQLFLPSTNLNKISYFRRASVFFYLHKKIQKISTNIETTGLPKIHFVPRGDNGTLGVHIPLKFFFLLYWHFDGIIIVLKPTDLTSLTAEPE